MLDWTELLDGEALGALVPEEYARYRPVVVDGLAFFLENLPPARVAAILADQAALPETADVAERLVAIARHSPALHKLGQIVARDRRLSPKLRQLLQGLESMPPSWSLDEVQAAVERELGPLSKLGIQLDGPPLAEASVAVVTPFLWPERGDGLPRRGVLKLLKPGIERALDDDLRLLQRVGAWLDERCRRYGLPEIAYEETFAQVRDLLWREVDLRLEQEHLRQGSIAYAGMDAVIVPEIYPISTARVTAMTRIDGRKVTEVDDLPPHARRTLGAVIGEALLARPFWSEEAASLFHADPHAGNLLVTDGAEPKLAILDWSLAGTLSKEARVLLSQMLLGAFTLDAALIDRAIAALAEGSADAPALRQVVDEHLRRVARGALPGLGWLTALLDDAVLRAGAHFAGDLLLLRKVLHVVEGVVGDVSAQADLDMVLAASFLTRFGLEAAGPRLLAPPESRRFATHLSNLDLAQALLLAAPLAVWRWWLLLWPRAARA